MIRKKWYISTLADVNGSFSKLLSWMENLTIACSLVRYTVRVGVVIVVIGFQFINFDLIFPRERESSQGFQNDQGAPFPYLLTGIWIFKLNITHQSI